MILRLLAAAALLGGFFVPAFADFEQEDLVCETTTHTGTGRTTINLSGTACTNYLTFASGGVDNGDTVTVTIVSGDGKIETGHATFNDAAPDTLTGYTVLASSDGVATALNLSGTSNIYLQWNSHSFGGGVGVWDIATLNVDDIVLADAGTVSFVGGDVTISDGAAPLYGYSSVIYDFGDLDDLGLEPTAITVRNANDDNASAAGIITYMESATPADDDIIGFWNAAGKDDAGNDVGYLGLHFQADDVTNGSEDGRFEVLGLTDNVSTSWLSVGGTITPALWNFTGAGDLLPGTDSVSDIGSASLAPANIFTDSITIAGQQFDQTGTWSPTITGSTTNPTVTYFVQEGRWSKVGSRVHINIAIVINTYSGGSGDVRISLPFAVNSSVTAVAMNAITGGINWGTSKTQVTGQAAGGDSFMVLIGLQSNGSAVNIPVGNVAAGDSIVVTATYEYN